jgi:nucleotide-binding universal stress UspA family protein
LSEFVGAKLAKDPTIEMVTTIKALTEFAAPTVGARTRSVEVPRATTRRMESPGRGDHAVPGAGQMLVPVDFSDDSLRALNFAGGLAREFGASIALVHVVARSGFAGPFRGGEPDTERMRREAAARIQEWQAVAVSRCRRAGAAVAVGRPAAEIVAAAERLGVDLVVLTSRGRSGLRRLLGRSTAEGAVKASTRPVLVVPKRLLVEGSAGASPGTGSLWNNLLVPVDGGEAGQAALRYAAAWASTMRSRLTLFRVLSPGAREKGGNPFRGRRRAGDGEWQAVARREVGEGIEVQILPGQGVAEADVILKAADGARSEVVVLTLDKTGRRIASGLVRASRCAVLAVPEPAEGPTTVVERSGCR